MMNVSRRFSVLFALAGGLLLAADPLSAATIIQGGHVGGQTWNIAESPYIVMGDVLVPTGATLTIDPGAEVRCASSDAQGAGRNPARVELTINGTLDVRGTASAPVTFRGQTASAGSWYGIVMGVGSSSTLSHVVIQHTMNGVVCEGQTTASDIRMFANQTAINVSSGGSLTVRRGVIHGNVVQGVQVNQSAASTVQIENCTIHGNGTYGVYIGSVSGAPATVNVVNTVITGHGYGVYRSPASNASTPVRYSDVWGNGTNLFNVVAGSGFFSADPLYIDANGADNIPGNADDYFHLQPNSPCGFAGQAQDDIGAYPILRVVMRPLRFIGNDARIPISAIPDRLHQLQYTTDLTNWFAFGTPIRAASGSLEFADPGVKPLPKRFYRIRLTD